MIPFDTKDYRAKRDFFSMPGWAVIGIVALLMLLGWMGERDREAHIQRTQAAAQCYE